LARGSNGSEPLIPVDEIARRSNQYEQRIISYLEYSNKKLETYWDGTPATSPANATWVLERMADDDARQAVEDQARGEALLRQLEEEQAAANRRAAERNRRRVLPGGVEASKPSDEREWAE
jgi:hypothetical protein